MGGVLYSSHLLNHLVSHHHLSREQAYSLIQEAAFGLKENESLESKVLQSKQLKKYFTAQDVKNIFSGLKHLNSIQKRIKKYEKNLA
jgi:adenylosuccinate lyase